jgi:hypothetical protein
MGGLLGSSCSNGCGEPVPRLSLDDNTTLQFTECIRQPRRSALVAYSMLRYFVASAYVTWRAAPLTAIKPSLLATCHPTKPQPRVWKCHVTAVILQLVHQNRRASAFGTGASSPTNYRPSWISSPTVPCWRPTRSACSRFAQTEIGLLATFKLSSRKQEKEQLTAAYRTCWVIRQND